MVLAGRTIKPMKAAPGELPVTDDWVYEIKWDGMRSLAFIEAGEVRLQTTNLLDSTVSFPELAALGEALADYDSLILDGEIVAFDDDGKPSFGRIQQRMHVTDPADAARRAALVPTSFVIFDVLHINGNDTFSLPFSDRRRLLEQIVAPGPSWRVTTLHADGGAELLQIVIDQQLEGLIAKRPDSSYHVGKRSQQWRKIKPRQRQEFVVGGWLGGEGSRAGSFGSVHVGYYDGDELRYAGRVGSGFNGADLDEWTKLLAPLARHDSPFADEVPPKPGRPSHWVEPELVIEVAYGEWSEGHQLRHPSYMGRRFDKEPREVTGDR